MEHRIPFNKPFIAGKELYYIAQAVEVLDNILHKMDAHQYKKVSRLRKLHW